MTDTNRILNDLACIKEYGEHLYIEEIKEIACNSEKAIKELQIKLEQYRDTEKEGRYIKLPVQIGAIVYKKSTQRDNYDDREYPIIIQVLFRIELLPCFGKTVFLTYKEAEAALGRKGE